MLVRRRLIARKARKACSIPSGDTHPKNGGTVEPNKRPQGPAGDVALWRELAFKSEANGDMVPAVRYWQAAIAAAKLLTPPAADADLKWLRERLVRANAVLQHLAGSAAGHTVQ